MVSDSNLPLPMVDSTRVLDLSSQRDDSFLSPWSTEDNDPDEFISFARTNYLHEAAVSPTASPVKSKIPGITSRALNSVDDPNASVGCRKSGVVPPLDLKAGMKRRKKERPQAGSAHRNDPVIASDRKVAGQEAMRKPVSNNINHGDLKDNARGASHEQIACKSHPSEESGVQKNCQQTSTRAKASLSLPLSLPLLRHHPLKKERPKQVVVSANTHRVGNRSASWTSLKHQTPFSPRIRPPFTPANF